ncbi:hypothetical protein JCGZ_15948 [Jatropha curcas]|uniref:DOG1 domain-containing protein n=1 Tax=Jatropha curcas TaxID=180498 RepID=A0A067KZA5_JATCU|nr:protein ZW2 [Jatropha curcas]KDP41541.1 hypothetical protein JCGZ_15948 [Jatropha curcas]
MARPSENFETFFNGWLDRLQALSEQLRIAIEAENAQRTEYRKYLIDQVLSHYKLYYQVKVNAAREDPFLFLNPPWLSSFERTLLWLGDFNPSVIFKLIDRSVTDLTPEQIERIKEVKLAIRREERVLSDTMASIQESLASPPILNLARRFGRSGRLIDGEVSEIEVAEDMLKTQVHNVLESADALRGLTVAKVLEILSPVQSVTFMIAAADFQLRMRRLGQQTDALRVASND